MKLIPFCWCAMQNEIDFPYADPTWSDISWDWVKPKWHQSSLLYLGKDGGVTKFWDDLQKTGCCGTLGYEDWEKVFPNAVPDSCCKVTSVQGVAKHWSSFADSDLHGSASFWKPDPDPHPFGRQIRFKVKSRIRTRIRIKVEIQELCVEAENGDMEGRGRSQMEACTLTIKMLRLKM